MNIKHYIAKQLLGKTLHFKCDCLIHLDFIGQIKDFEIVDNEIVFIIDSDGKVVRIGENHPNLIIHEI